MVLTVKHTTTYRYARPVAFGEHRLMFRPRDDADQKVRSAELKIHPEPASVREFRDKYGNWVAIAAFDRAADELRFESVVRSVNRGGRGAASGKRGATALDGDLPEWRLRSFADPERSVDLWMSRAPLQPGGEPLDLLMRLNGCIRRSVRYQRRSEKGTQSPAQTLALGSGSCRDLAVLMIDAARSLGFAARFVSGYIHSPAHCQQQYNGGGSTHAWVQAFVPAIGWIDFDPTNDLVGCEDLVRVAVAPGPGEAVPLSGSWFGGAADSLSMTVSVSVTAQAPRRRQARPIGLALKAAHLVTY